MLGEGPERGLADRCMCAGLVSLVRHGIGRHTLLRDGTFLTAGPDSLWPLLREARNAAGPRPVRAASDTKCFVSQLKLDQQCPVSAAQDMILRQQRSRRRSSCGWSPSGCPSWALALLVTALQSACCKASACGSIELNDLANGGTFLLPAGCSSFAGVSTNVYSDLIFEGHASDGPDCSELDLQFSVHRLEPQPGAQITLRNMLLNNTIILTEEPLSPAFVDLHHPNASLLLDGVHMVVECAVLEQVLQALPNLQIQNVGWAGSRPCAPDLPAAHASQQQAFPAASIPALMPYT